MTEISFQLNGEPVRAQIEPRTSLAEFLRQGQNLTATHLGCEHGVCGACTVMVDGAPARSCIVFAVSLEGADVRTLEGYTADPLMDRMREAFHCEHALQCGFCTPGMLITARDIVVRFDALDDKRTRTELSGNLCRCTGYAGVVRAVQRVMKEVPAQERVALSSPVIVPPPVPAEVPAPSMGQVRPTPLAKPVDTTGWVRVDDSFVIPMARSQVWQLLKDTPAVARCVPGFEVQGATQDQVQGVMRVAFGPVKAAFASRASIERDDASLTGSLYGEGQDARGSSRATGKVTYMLEEGAGAVDETLVRIVMEYQLKGPLAQFSRSSLMRDFTSRLLASFAANLRASLQDTSIEGGASAPVVPVVPVSLTSIFKDMVRSWLRNLRGR